MSLYAEYIAEREGKGIVENDHGFVSYKIKGDECYLADIYISPEFRKEGIGAAFADEITKKAKEKGCKFLTGTVTPSLAGASTSLLAQLKYGFKLHSSHEDFIILKKEI